MSVSIERLRQVFSYDFETGDFTRLVSTSRSTKVGEKPASRKDGNYQRICIDSKFYQAHRVAWLFMTGSWPERIIDHIDHDPSNNKWSNLREVGNAENCWNRKARKGRAMQGVYARKTGKYFAQVRKDGVAYYLGTHPTPEAAHAAYCAKAKELFGEYFSPG